MGNTPQSRSDRVSPAIGQYVDVQFFLNNITVSPYLAISP